MPTLVIVDMQPGFENSLNENTIAGVQALAKSFRRKGHGIIVLEYICEYEDFGSTNERISKLIAGYKKAVFIGKDRDDGSKQVQQVCKEQGFDETEFHVCGVNLGCCVAETVYGMVDRYPKSKVHVRPQACNGGHFYIRHKNVSLKDMRLRRAA